MQYIDIHSHLADHYFDDSRDMIMKRMHDEGVGTISIGTDFATSQCAVALAETSDFVWACVGVHPDSAAEGFEAARYAELLAHPRTVAVGECGLDYFRTDDIAKAKQKQTSIFETQIECALDHDLPLMLHIRPSRDTLDAYRDALAILASYKQRYPALRGNSHFFAGDVEIARQFFDLEFTISFTGVVTFTHEYDEVIRFAPLRHIHAETDAPFVAPVPYRGEQCAPWMVTEVVTRMAVLRSIDRALLCKELLANASRLFRVT